MIMATTPAAAVLNDSTDDDEDYFADVGFMFESQQPVRLEQYHWDLPLSTTNVSDDAPQTTTIQIALHVADDHPGAVQSGHYLWPAARLLSDYLIQQYRTNDVNEAGENTVDRLQLHNNNNNNNNNITTVMELGAGCAMVSLVALQLYKETLQCLCITDHDPSTLVRARDNYETTVQELLLVRARDKCRGDQEDVDNNNDMNDECEDEQLNEIINTITNIPVLFESLEWGDVNAVDKLLQQTLPERMPLDIFVATPSSVESHTEQHHHTGATNYHRRRRRHHAHYFDLIVGSDLIYCPQVVRPLFTSVVQLMRPSSSSSSLQVSRFLLAQSFVYDTATEQEINDACREFQLQRTIVTDFHNDMNNNCSIDDPDIRCGRSNGRIQEFRFI